MADFNGSYAYIRSENLEEYLEKIGVPAARRAMIVSSSPSVTVTHDDSHYKVVIENMRSGKDHVIQFNLGEEFEDTFPDGLTLKCKGEVEGNSLKITSTEVGGKGEIDRVFSLNGGELIMVMKSPGHDIEAKRFFKKIH